MYFGTFCKRNQIPGGTLFKNLKAKGKKSYKFMTYKYIK